MTGLDKGCWCAILSLAYENHVVGLKPGAVMKSTPMYLLIAKSKNKKTGRMAVSTSPRQTCPTSCPFRDNGCYASYGPLMIWWDRCSQSVDDPAESWRSFCKSVSGLPYGTILRHNQAGDFVPRDRSNPIEIDAQAAGDLVAACHFGCVKGYTYTHYPVLYSENFPRKVVEKNRSLIEWMNQDGFVVNVSANSLSHADAILDSGLRAPVTALVKSGTIGRNFRTSKDRSVVICPAMWKEGMTCINCKGCMSANRRTIIAFPSHGTCRKRCDEVIDQWEGKNDKA